MKTRILFIDDDTRVLGSFERVVHPFRHEWDCRYLSQSEQAIAMLEQHPADLVVTDVRMPNVDGLELLSRIKEHSQLRDIEVLVVTGLADRTLKQNALELGAADLLNKPVSNEELIARLRGLSRMKRYQDELRRKNRELEQQLLLNQKMHLIGLLAGGTVHDLNNLLGLVKGYGQLLMGSGEMAPSVSEDLQVMLHSVDRALNLTRQIHAFTRIDPEQVTRVDVPALLQQLLRILKASIGKTTEISIHLPDNAPHILVVPESQIYQILLNLCINAIQAMDGEGVLRIHLERAERGLSLIVEDEGPGMEQEVMEHLFTPMVSTKREKGGSGLGLVMVKQIADNLGAIVDVVSKQGAGTRVSITFPESFDEGSD